MLDRSHFGRRCRTLLQVNTAQGTLRRYSEGTIRYEMDNLDRHLIFVDWDNGMTALVFPGEIEMLMQEGVLA